MRKKRDVNPRYFMNERLRIPKVCIHHADNEPMTGSFGVYPIYDIKEMNKPMNNFYGGKPVKFKDICFGPFVDFKKLKDSEIYPVDDFMLQYKLGENHMTIWDHDTLTNKPRQINWFDENDRPKPIIFKPVLSVNMVPKLGGDGCVPVINKYFRTVKKLNFGESISDIGNRFFEHEPWVKNRFDLSILFKLSYGVYELVLISTVDAKFKKCVICETGVAFDTLQNEAENLVKELEKIKEKRDKYFRCLYGIQKRK